MTDQITETTTMSWGQRLSRSLSGVVFAFALFVLSFPLLWWNEGRSVERIKALDAARHMVVEATPAAVDPADNERLVHMSGPATAANVVDDQTFGVRERALKLRRIVEMYQWEEKKNSDSRTHFGGSATQSTTYSYSKTWVQGRIDSSRFRERQRHENPASMPYGSREWVADIYFGAFRLNKDFVRQIDAYDDYPLTPGNYAALGSQQKSYFTLNGTEYFHGDPQNPQIGAIRIRYKIIRPAHVSAIGRQNGALLEAYDLRGERGLAVPTPPARTKATSLRDFFELAWASFDASATKSTETIALLQMGDVDSDRMFATALRQNQALTWMVRLGGCLLMWIGITSFFSPLKVLADFMPFLGDLVGVSIAVVAALAAVVLSFTTIAMAWIYYRPLLGGALVAVAALAGYAIFRHLQDVWRRGMMEPAEARFSSRHVSRPRRRAWRLCSASDHSRSNRSGVPLIASRADGTAAQPRSHTQDGR